MDFRSRRASSMESSAYRRACRQFVSTPAIWFGISVPTTLMGRLGFSGERSNGQQIGRRLRRASLASSDRGDGATHIRQWSRQRGKLCKSLFRRLSQGMAEKTSQGQGQLI